MVIVDDVVCTTPGCPHRGVKDAGNLALRRVYGPDGIRFLRCRTCKTEFSERRGTPMFDLHLPRAKIIDVVKHLAEGVPGRNTARLTGAAREIDGE